jgi:hypothetical protein
VIQTTRAHTQTHTQTQIEMKKSYAAWEAFDTEAALDEVDVREAQEVHSRASVQLLQEQASEAQRVRDDVEQTAEAIKSKVLYAHKRRTDNYRPHSRGDLC